MKELSIERMEMVNGGRCSIVDMSWYAYQSTAASTAAARLYYTYKLWDCMSQI
jgi:hypothetical protein